MFIKTQENKIINLKNLKILKAYPLSGGNSILNKDAGCLIIAQNYGEDPITLGWYSDLKLAEIEINAIFQELELEGNSGRIQAYNLASNDELIEYFKNH